MTGSRVDSRVLCPGPQGSQVCLLNQGTPGKLGQVVTLLGGLQSQRVDQLVRVPAELQRWDDLPLSPFPLYLASAMAPDMLSTCTALCEPPNKPKEINTDPFYRQEN